MNRRNFLEAGTLLTVGAAAASVPAGEGVAAQLPSPPPLPFQDEKSDLKITSIRMVQPRPSGLCPGTSRRPDRGPQAGPRSRTQCQSIPNIRPQRSLFMANDLGPGAVEISTDKGIKGIGYGGPGCGFVIEKHLTKLLMGEDPFNVEELWDIMWRSTLYYGRKGLVVHAISAIDHGPMGYHWQRFGDAHLQTAGRGNQSREFPVTAPETISTSTSNSVTSGVKLAVPYGPADGREGMKKNTELVKQTRELVGPDGDIMLDCWMALTEDYSIEFAEMVAPIPRVLDGRVPAAR